MLLMVNSYRILAGASACTISRSMTHLPVCRYKELELPRISNETFMIKSYLLTNSKLQYNCLTFLVLSV